MAGPTVADGEDDEQEEAVCSGALLEACSILHPAPASGPGCASTGKRHGKSSLPVGRLDSQWLEFPGLPQEPAEGTQLRSKAFFEVWSAIEQRVQTALEGLGESTLEAIQKWIAREHFDNQFEEALAQRESTGDRHRATGRPFSSELPAALLFVGGVDWGDHRSTFAKLAAHLPAHLPCQVATLQPKDFHGSATSSGSVAVKRLLRQFTGVEPETADMEVLAAWHGEREAGGSGSGSRAHLVVLLEDVEGCDAAALDHFLLLLCEWRAQLPLVLVLGLGTSAGTLRRLLPPAVMARLRTQRFVLPPAQQRLDVALQAALLAPASALLPGRAATRFLLSLTHHRDPSLAALMRCLKMAALDHFASQPLSPLCALLQQAAEKTLLEERCRELPPWLTRQAEEKLDVARCKAGSGEGPAGQLAQRLQTLQQQHHHWRAALLCLHAAAAQANAAPAGGLCGTMAAVAVQQPRGRPAAPLVAACATAMKSMKGASMEALLESWADLCRHAPALCAQVEAVRGAGAAPGGEGAAEAPPAQTEGSGVSSAGGKGGAPDPTPFRGMASRAGRAQMGLSVEMRRRNALQSAGPVPSLPPSLRERMVELLHRMARDAASVWTGERSGEVFVLSLGPQLQQAVVASQRGSLAVDLLAPQVALRCACCGTGARGGASLPDTCLAYALCRRQPAEEASVPEWYSAFAAELSSAQQPQPKRDRPSKRRRHDSEKKELSGGGRAAVQYPPALPPARVCLPQGGPGSAVAGCASGCWNACFWSFLLRSFLYGTLRVAALRSSVAASGASLRHGWPAEGSLGASVLSLSLASVKAVPSEPALLDRTPPRAEDALCRQRRSCSGWGCCSPSGAASTCTTSRWGDGPHALARLSRAPFSALPPFVNSQWAFLRLEARGRARPNCVGYGWWW